MKCVKVPLKEIQKVKDYLKKEKNLKPNYVFLKTPNFIYFPVKKIGNIKKKFPFLSVVEKNLKKTPQKRSIKDSLKNKLSLKEIKKLKTSYDVVGDILILEVDSDLEKKEELIAKTLLSLHKNIKTIVKKKGAHIGEFRLQKYKHLGGKRKKEITHKENNVLLNLNIEKTYFSPRLSTERKRISSLVKKGESVLVMFSGCAPYPLVISKNSGASRIVGIEINPVAHMYAEKNIKLNKSKNIKLFLGDVRKVVPSLKMRFDRIIMPLPKDAENFLGVALSSSKKGTTIHFYDFLSEEEIPKKSQDKIRNACKNARVKYKIVNVIKCGQHSPRTYRVCIDFQII